MARLGMVIDLKRCFGCYACQIACKAEHLTPPGVFWGRCLKGEGGTYPTVTRQSLPVLCMQCQHPECLKVCPTGATQQRVDGVVFVDHEKCIGCKYCMMACPYGARHPAGPWTSYFPDGHPLTEFEEYARKRWVGAHGEGTSTKCDFCKERVEKGLQPSCVQACPAKARYFGDLEDPDSEVAMLIRTERGFQLNPEFGTDPSVYYLPAR